MSEAGGLPRNRHLPWLVALLLFAALPVLFATFRPGRWDDCADPEALRDIGSRLAGTEGRDGQVSVRSHLFQRHEATLPVAGLHPLRVRVVRTDEVRYPFDHQTKFLRVPMDPERSAVRWVDNGDGRLPIHFVYAHQAGAIRVVASLFVYDGQVVDRLLAMQLRSAPRQLMAGRRPMTLLQVDGFGAPPRQEQIEDAAIAWLLSGWRVWSEICRPGVEPLAADP